MGRMSPAGWRSIYTGMIRAIMTYGMEIAGREGGNTRQIEEMGKFQHQALLKAIGGIQGSKKELMNHMPAVESIPAKLNSM